MNMNNNYTLELHKELNPNLWVSNRLRSDVRNKIFRIVHKFDTITNWIDENTCVMI